MNNLSIREKNLLLVALLLLVTALSYMYIIQPKWEDYQKSKIQLETKLQTLDMLQTAQQQLSRGKSVEDIKAELGKLDIELPNRPETAELIHYLKAAALRKGAVMNRYKVGEIKDATFQGGKSLPLTLTFSGSFAALQGVIGEFERFPRAVWIQQGILQKTSSPAVPLTATLQVEFFFLPQDRPYVNKIVPPGISRRQN